MRERVGTLLFITGNPNFEPEKVTAYEVGSRVSLPPRLSLSATLFYNDYKDLRSIEPNPATGFLPVTWGNEIEGHAYGVEAWAEWQVTRWWRLTPGVRLLTQRPKFSAGASGLLGLSQVGDDPRDSYSLRSAMDLGSRWRLDADFRRQGALPDPKLPAYDELDGRLAFNATDRIEIGLIGLNLLHARHQEYPGGYATTRKFAVQLRARF